jgi:hypothetical protein
MNHRLSIVCAWGILSMASVATAGICQNTAQTIDSLKFGGRPSAQPKPLSPPAPAWPSSSTFSSSSGCSALPSSSINNSAWPNSTTGCAAWPSNVPNVWDNQPFFKAPVQPAAASASAAATTEIPSPGCLDAGGGTYRPIVIRLKRYRALNEMDIVWEATNMANQMLLKGADVTILLDMDAVNAANRNDTQNATFELWRGNGSSTQARASTPQDHLVQFTEGGGHLLASKRWVTIYSISNQALVPSTQLISDDRITTTLLNRNITLIDY